MSNKMDPSWLERKTKQFSLICLFFAWTDTACIGYYGVARTRANAQATCESMQASLISLRDHSNLPSIYRETSPKFRRKKRQSDLIDATIGWTSAQAKTPSNRKTR